MINNRDTVFVKRLSKGGQIIIKSPYVHQTKLSLTSDTLKITSRNFIRIITRRSIAYTYHASFKVKVTNKGQRSLLGPLFVDGCVMWFNLA